MSEIRDLLSGLKNENIHLWIEGDRLKFSAPKGGLTEQQRESLRANKEAILAFLSQDDPSQLKIPKFNRNEPLKLSSNQALLWTFQNIHPESAAYNIPYTIRLTGSLSYTLLENAYHLLIARHDSLRSKFYTLDGFPYQIALNDPTPLNIIRLSELKNPHTSLSKLIKLEYSRHFNLSKDILIRASLYQCNVQEHIFQLTLHHIIADGYSLAVLQHELFYIYTCLLEDRDVDLPDPPIQYSDFAQWQAASVKENRSKVSLDFFRQHLEHCNSILELPSDYPRSPEASFTGRTQPISISPQLIEKFHAACVKTETTPFIFFYSIFASLLYRYSGQEDILIGTPMANREYTNCEGVIGVFMNTIIFRSCFNSNFTFRQLLEQTKTQILNCITHQSCPLELIYETLEVERSVNRNPLFQVMFNYQKKQTPVALGKTLSLEQFDFDRGFSHVDLSLSIEDRGSYFFAAIEYNSQLFNTDKIKRMSDHFLNTIQTACENIDSQVSSIQLLAHAEYNALIERQNASSTLIPKQNFPELFLQTSRKFPDKDAVIFAGSIINFSKGITYDQLEQTSTLVSANLRRRGIGPGDNIGIYFQRSIEMVTSLLAVMKAGATYIPLDPLFPKDRLSYMAKDANLRAVLTHHALDKDRFDHSCDTILIEQTIEKSPFTESTFPQIPLESIAYIIYTSGSTGLPKGVPLTHHNLINFLISMAIEPGFSETDRLLAVTTLSFDIAGLELYLPLLQGGTVVVTTKEQAMDGHQLSKLITDHEITVMQATPITWRLLIDAKWPDRPLTALCGGEALPLDLAEEIGALSPSFWNVYGPTETTIWSSVYKVNILPRGPIPIGKAIANTQLYTCDRNFMLQPVGVPGELLIGGDGLAMGYLNRPSLTAQQFIPNPFSAPGSRLYRTGDLALLRSDGNFECLGRIDNQVKLRGFRIELGEIESALVKMSSISAATVLVREMTPGDFQLVGYIIAREHSTIDTDDLSTHLAQALPTYMIPSSYVIMDMFPRTPNNKIDRKAFPLPTTTTNRSIVEPRNPIESSLLTIWSEVLSVDKISVLDNFFKLGGHSLSAARVFSRIKANMSIEAPLMLIFKHPTIAELARALPVITIEQYSRLQPAPRYEPLPLSFFQERLWFIQSLQPDSSAYNISFALTLEGSFQQELLTRALNALLDRHEALRTTIGQDPNLPNPFQVILEKRSAVLTKQTCSSQKQLDEALLLHSNTPFDLKNGPLSRFYLMHCNFGPNVYVFQTVLHHIISDGLSLNILLRDLSAIYESLLLGSSANIPELILQFADYAYWERRTADSNAMSKNLQFWKTHLQDAPFVLELPADRPRPPQFLFDGKSVPVHIERDLTKKLHDLAFNQGITLYMLLLGGFSLLLRKYTNAPELLLGSPVATRDTPEVEHLIGCFVNTLVLRTDMSGNPTVREFLSRVKASTLLAFEHRDFPYEQLVDSLQPERELSRNPLFQVMFNLQSQNKPEYHSSTLLGRSLAFDRELTHVDLTLALQDDSEVIQGAFEYCTALYNHERIERMAAHFYHLLEQMTECPSLPIDQLVILSNQERRRILALNQPLQDIPSGRLEDRFFRHAEEYPDKIAIRCRGNDINYRELALAACNLATTLLDKGILAESVVAICLEREPILLVSMLAVLKAGGAFVSLDPAYPKDRLAFILQDTSALFILSQAKLSELLPLTSAEVIHLDEPFPVTDVCFQPKTTTTCENLAYLIYTSGSTGKPKGVAIHHQCATVLCHWARDVFDDRDLSGVLFSTSTNFDLSIFEIFVTLSWGGCLYIVKNALELVDQPELPITLLNTVPSVMSELIKAHAVPPTVRTINLAGEALPLKLVQQIYEETKAQKVFNLYGPSEDTTYSTFALVSSQASWVPIGRPITNTQAYILDPQLCLLPMGIPGELYLGGDGLARGYLDRGGLTAERFLANPFSEQPGSRFYKTGDLARYQNNGDIEYLGRLDHQVKLRGFRIELGEIESRLTSYPGCSESLVMVRDDSSTSHLVAYMVPNSGIELTPSHIEKFLKAHLPEYMVPTRFIILESWPLTPNKKVDRKALPMPESSSSLTTMEFKPKNPWEEVLGQIWADILAIDLPDSHSNFFKLGGHSLLAVRVLSKIRQTFGIEISLVDFFGSPTIEGLARLLGNTGQASDHSDLVTAHEPDWSPQLSFPQKSLWFIDKLQPENPAYNIFVGYHIYGALSTSHLQEALTYLVNRHEALRTSFPAIDGTPCLTVSTSFDTNLNAVDLKEQNELLAEMAIADGRRPFNLGVGPLFRITLFQLADKHHVLLLGTHHIISDGWSLAVFVRELITVYHQLITGDPAQLPELSLKYTDFSAWQQRRLIGAPLKGLLSFWEKNLSGANFLLELPIDKPRPAVQRFHGTYHPIRISPEQARMLALTARSSGTTNYMVLVSIFAILLSRYSRQNDLLLGSPVAGRNQTALEGVFGFFVNSLVLRIKLEGHASFLQLLERVRAQSLAAWSNSDLPFDLLVEHLQPERDLSRNPIFQVMFSLQETQPIKGDTLTIVPEYFDTGVAHFDLTLALETHDDGYSGVLEYNSDLFEPSSIARMAVHFQNLLESALTDTGKEIASLSMIHQEERHTLVCAWNQTNDPYPAPFFHERVAQIAVQSPDTRALIVGSTTLTYSQLDKQADLLAQKLVRMGVRSDSVVGICLPRTSEMFVAVLAILKAGGAYLALDPNYPAERLKFMIQDSEPAAIITSALQCDVLPPTQTKLIIGKEAYKVPELTGTLQNRFDASQLAYVIYTSGTTGTPKGVMITQGGLSNLLVTQRAAFPLKEEDRVLVFSSLNFDASVFLLTWGWQFGVPVYTAPRNELLGKGLEDFLINHKITTVLFPPSVLPSLDPTKLPLLQNLIVGGEAVSPEQATTWARERRLINAYGPTEVTVWGTFTLLAGTGTAPIGKPVANARCYVLDPRLQLQPIGVPGELMIAGAGLARGYLKRTRLTAQAFIPNPFAEEDGLSKGGQRLYRTGDLVRWNRCGELEYLGRIDHQVKIRGFRVEPGEIASRLLEHSDIRDAFVMPREDKPGELRLVAYVLTHEKTALTTKLMRDFLAERLPNHMIPSAFVVLESFPLTADGSKVDRGALPKPGFNNPAPEVSSTRPSTSVETAIIDTWKELLQVDQVAIDDNFFDLGGHSLLLTQVQSRLSAHFKRQIAITELFQYPTVSGLAEFLSPGHVEKALKVHTNQRSANGFEEIAIIGMAGRFPMADDVDTFWSNLEKGKHCITFFGSEELHAAGISPALLQNPDYVPAIGYLDDIECFDASLFGYSPREARILDPQQRQFLQGAWHALEHAGYNPNIYPGRIALFAGTSSSTYMTENLLANPALVESAGMMTITLGNDKDFLPTRVAYKLNLKGPSINVQTACSTSLVAVHLACMSLLHGECEMAMAGGVRLILPRKTGYLYQEGGITSPDGHCRAFDIEARGVLGGSGYGVVVLKRLADALVDGDTIWALIKGTAINNDGSDKIGFTAPSIEGQAGVVAQAQAVANVHPDTIGFIEAHGTGTELGDPIEIAALSKAFRLKTDRKGYCAIGSAKTNIGHLDAAAGIVGLIKTALVLKHKKIPASLHFNLPNPNIDFANSPFYVNASLRDFPRGETPRRAAISSFGLGGTNAHAILEEAPPSKKTDPARMPVLIPLSAANESALDQIIDQLKDYLASPHSADLADVAYTLQIGRIPLRKRAIVVAANTSEALTMLHQKESMTFAKQDPGDPRLVFMFPGQGAQYMNMARHIYDQDPRFQEDVDTCCDMLLPHLGLDLRKLLYPPPTLDAKALTKISAQLNQTEITQPALFTISYCMARTCIACGLRPDAMIGHSIGEFVAATLAGVFSLEDALMLVAARGRLMQGLPSGDMLAVPLSEDDLLPLLVGRHVSLAAINAPMRCVVSGPTEEIECLNEFLTQKDLACRILHTSHAFHSQMMDDILEPFIELMRSVEMKSPKGRFISNVSGTWITTEQATDPQYWAMHLRGTVRFADGLATLLQEKATRFFLEIGPGKTLNTFLQQQLDRQSTHGRAQTLRHVNDSVDDMRFFTETLGQLWLAGAHIDWIAFQKCHRRRVPLPTYPFKKDRFWVEPGPSEALHLSGSLKKSFNIDDWFYLPSWKRQPHMVTPIPSPATRSHWLIFEDAMGLGQALTRTLEDQGNRVTRLRVGRHFEATGGSSFAIDPSRKEDFEALYTELGRRGDLPTKMIHLWNLTQPELAHLSRVQFAEICADRGFFTLMYLAQTLEKLQIEDKVHLAIVTNGMQEIHDGDLKYPEKATLLGAVKVLPREFPDLTLRSIDIELPSIGALEATVQQLILEVEAHSPDIIVALRGRHRWIQTFDQVPVKASQPSRLRKGGTYLITGGLSGVGLMLAAHLSRNFKARLVLTRRSPFPRRDDWDQWFNVNGSEHPISQVISSLREMEKSGAAVLAISGDVADRTQMAQIVAEAHNRFGKIDGVIHAAGVLPSGMFSDMTAPIARKTFQAKVNGTLALSELLAGEGLDFLMLFSSTSAILGNMGYGDYVAANCFLDAFAQQQSAQQHGYTVSVNWDGWQEVGMAVGRASDQTLSNAISNTEGCEVVDRILSAPPHNGVIVSTMNLNRMIDEIRQFMGAQANGDLADELEKVHADEPLLERPDTVGFAAPSNDTEKRVAAHWCEALGFAKVGRHDDFFELGGDSLLGTMLATKHRKIFKVKFGARLISELPTVAQQAAYIDDQLAESIKVIRPEYVAPESETETLVVNLLQDLLNEAKIGIKDSFTALGGNLAKAVTLANRITETLSISLSAEMILEQPVIEELSESIDTLLWASGAMPESQSSSDITEFEL